MALETLDDINQILAQCCCEMPECPLPTRECQSIDSSIRLNGYLGDDEVNGEPVYRIAQLAYSGSDPAILRYERDTVIFVVVGGEDYSAGDGSITITTTGTTYDSPLTTTYEEGYTQVQAREAGQIIIDANLDFDDIAQDKGSDCIATTVIALPPGDLLFEVFQTNVRFRWVIPDTWVGSYFKITWDLATYPTDPAAEISYLQDLTWEWTGPGDPEDAASWQSPWYEIDPPGDVGERKVVNIRYECYRPTAFGMKPQITGDAEDIANDVPLQRRYTSDRHSINLITI